MGRKKVWSYEEKMFYSDALEKGKLPTRALINDWVALRKRYGDRVLKDDFVPRKLNFIDKATIAERIENGESYRTIGLDYERRANAIRDVYRRYLKWQKWY